MHQRALLILIGGRQTPNVLTAQFLKPDLIVPIASHEAMRPGDTWSKIVPVLKQLCPDGVLDPIAIDAFHPGQIQTTIEEILGKYANTTWWVNITCGTTLMSLGANEAAKKFPECGVWYLDSNHRRVITLQGEPPQGDVFRLSVGEYLTAYHRQPKPARAEVHLTKKLELAQAFYKEREKLWKFKTLLANQDAARLPKDQFSTITFQTSDLWNFDVCQLAVEARLIRTLTPGFESLTIKVFGRDFWNFVNGGWFEFFVWDAARQAGCFDDVQMSVEIPGQFGLNELDLAATVSANLLIAECKTDANPFLSKSAKEKRAEIRKGTPGRLPDRESLAESGTAYLDKLNSVSSFLGGSYVTKLFICTSPAPHPGRAAHDIAPYESFIGQAKERQIIVITGDQLHQLPTILREQAERPTYPRT